MNQDYIDKIERSWPKTAVAILAGVYFLWCTTNYSQWHWLDNVNLIIHEAGHWIFFPFGQFLYIAGGSIFQVLIPLVFFAYFFLKRDYFSSGFPLLWAGESMLNVARYAGDSLKMELPLLGGETSIHDWHWILNDLHLLPHTYAIATIIQILGALLIILGTYLSIRYAYKNDNDSSL